MTWWQNCLQQRLRTDQSLQAITTISLPVPLLSPAMMSDLDVWMRSLLWNSAFPSSLPRDRLALSAAGASFFEIYRAKGRVALADGSSKYLQGVREVFEFFDAAPTSTKARPAEQRQLPHCAEQVDPPGKLVFIGTGLDAGAFSKSLRDTLRL